MQISDFEKELQTLDKNLGIRPNNPPKRVQEMFPDVMKLASITYAGTEICTVPSEEIFDEPNGNYGVDLRQDGRFIKHRTRPDALAIVKQTLERLQNDKEFADSFFGRGEYSDAALRSRDEVKGDITLVEEVPIDVQQIKGGMLEGKHD